MSEPEQPLAAGRRPWILAVITLLAMVAIIVGLVYSTSSVNARQEEKPTKKTDDEKAELEPQLAPELDGGIAWLNTSGPIKMKDLKGKVVLLDFWTLCCINCIHVLPDLAKLEKKYPNELVVIGVHSAKFENEKDTKSIRQAILRYEIAHPVVNDAEHKIWNRFGVNSWPTVALVDPEGKYLGQASGEGNFELLDKIIGKLVKDAKAKGTLDEKPLRFDLIRYRETKDTPLFFPGKVHADGKSNRLFIADSTHHRIVITDLAGNKIDIVGTGSPGRTDGGFDIARFDDPQGMALDGETLYVADRKNHCIRAIDLKTKTVSTVAGTGTQDGDATNRRLEQAIAGTSIGLNSPWDLLVIGRELYIAMAGHHQIWTMELDTKKIKPYAGDGRENIKDGPLYAARFAQPSGIATDGKFLYVADSEVSAIRKVPLGGEGRVTTLVGEGLFEFGDVDGTAEKVRLQHALGVIFHEGKLIIADTYNSKLKFLDPNTRTCTTFLGGDDADSFFAGPLFDEPAGLSIANCKVYVADTNASRIRVVDLATKKVSTLTLTGVLPPPPQKEWLPPTEPKK